ncbi:hypothetical protein MIM_c28930 [Advenella mimigardefordensis DPN7]|uniref:Lipoprotein n=1 Tax=Advenella mimigardefordensis (strain DSM 17166 / LMG 22922 / DPN7) TaxID=1247726 RepID=W0PIW9_ADVMD|nr:hypothetical protein MIM_c28930 [Advenella mimigardefordensis DPN7]
MKKMLVVAGMLTIFLSGCVIHDRHSGYRDGYRYKGNKYERGYHNKGNFCPPGQAKKGRC